MKLTLGKKLGLGFGVILALMVFSAAMSYEKSGSIKASQDITFEVRYPTLAACKDLQRDLNQTQSKGRQVVLAGVELARRDAGKKLFDGTWDDIGKDVAKLDELAPKWTVQENRDRLAAMKPHIAELRAAQEAAMNHAADGDKEAVIKGGNEFADQATPANEAIKVSLDGMAKSFAEMIVQNKEDLHAENRSLTVTMAVTTLLALGIGIFVAIFLSRSISGSTQAVLLQAEAIASGDLTRDDLKVQSKDELGDLVAPDALIPLPPLLACETDEQELPVVAFLNGIDRDRKTGVVRGVSYLFTRAAAASLAAARRCRASCNPWRPRVHRPCRRSPPPVRRSVRSPRAWCP